MSAGGFVRRGFYSGVFVLDSTGGCSGDANTIKSPNTSFSDIITIA